MSRLKRIPGMPDRALKWFAALASVMVVSTPAYALQVLQAGDEGTVHHARFSRDEMTRLAIKDGRIVSMHFPEGRLTVETDEEHGFAILRARDDKPVSLVVTSNTGQTHSIYLTPENMGMDTILVHEKQARAPIQNAQSRDARIEPQTSMIKRLMLAMARNETQVRDYLVEAVGKDMDLWQESHFHLLDKFSAPDVVGYRFMLTNVSDKPMRLGEQEFYKRGVVAVAIDRHVLAPGERTLVFVIMVRNDG